MTTNQSPRPWREQDFRAATDQSVGRWTPPVSVRVRFAVDDFANTTSGDALPSIQIRSGATADGTVIFDTAVMGITPLEAIEVLRVIAAEIESAVQRDALLDWMTA
ncbi:hypothetical protein [Nocardioides ferulae]|uniref:hypothetical protein n=1 Tax=Nocardioides ferulae TaxID=2340821 RepID=UPI000F89802C|nr:hypothetical protein [Nocardioides ferulae]